MGKPTWRELKKVQVPERPANIWTPALDYVTPAKIYRIVVEARPNTATPPAPEDQKWTPGGSQTACTADGDPTLTRAGPLVIGGGAAGALIGKVGGSTADIKPDDKVILFTVGRHCVFSISDAAKTGSLFLGINDVPATIAGVQGQLEVTIYEAL